MLGWGGRDLGWVGLFVCLFVCFFFVLVLCVGWGWDLFGKMPCDLRRPFSIVHVVTSA